MEMSRDNAEKGRNLFIRKNHVTMTKKMCVYKYRYAAQNRSLTIFHKNKTLLSATSILSRSPMAYNTTTAFDKLFCTDYVDFDECQGRFG